MTTDAERHWEAFLGGLGRALAPETSRRFTEFFDAAVAGCTRGELPVDRVAFAAFLGEKVSGSPNPVTELSALRMDDLLLVCALATDLHGAQEAFDAVLRPVAARVHASVSTGRSFDELLQELRMFLLIPRPERAARIREFGGRSSLSRWLHVASTRCALNLVRCRPREEAFEEAFFLAHPDLQTPEARLLDATYGERMRTAVRRALATLGEREQSLLWFSLVDERTNEHIAKIYGVHRTTALRWVERATLELRRALEDELATSDGLANSQIASIVRTVLAR